MDKDLNIKTWFDEDEDIFYISFKEGFAVDSEEIKEDIIIEYNEKGEVIGVELHNISKMLAKSIAERIKEIMRI